MKKGIHYDKVYSLVAGWPSISIILILVAIEGWKTIQVDYVQAFSQAPIEKYIYLKIPSGFQLKDGYHNDYALKLHRNIYGQKKYGRVCYKYLTKKIIMELGLTKSDINECVFYRGSVM